MSYMLCDKLIPMASSIVSHGFQKTTDRFLVAWRDASVLRHKQILHFGKRFIGQCCAYAIDDIAHIETQLGSRLIQVGSRWIAGTRLIVSLRTFRDTHFFSELILRKSCLGTQLSQPNTDLFRQSQIISTRIFTLAIFCHILRSSSHENARNCTMPNTSITEQARKQAREALEKRGQSAKDFAELHDLNPSTVYAVLSGQSRCRRGEAHRAAVLLGIKDGVIEQ